MRYSALDRPEAIPTVFVEAWSCIQRFEFTFELSWRMIKRRLERDLPVADTIDTMSYRGVIRTAGEYGLVEDVSAWFLSLRHILINADKAADAFSALPVASGRLVGAGCRAARLAVEMTRRTPWGYNTRHGYRRFL
jgi:hypothetical protein